MMRTLTRSKTWTGIKMLTAGNEQGEITVTNNEHVTCSVSYSASNILKAALEVPDTMSLSFLRSDLCWLRASHKLRKKLEFNISACSVKYKFIKTNFIKKNFSSKSTFIKNHFHQKPLSPKTNFIKKPLSSKNHFHQKCHFHQKTLSSKTTFIKNHFHQNPISSKTNFIRDHFHQKPFSSNTNFIKNQFHQSTSCQRDPPPEQKQYSPCLCESVAGRRPATPSHKHGLCPPLGSQLAFLLNIAGRRPAMFSRKAR